MPTTKKTPPTDAQILAAIKANLTDDAVLTNLRGTTIAEVRRSCRADAASIIRVACAAGLSTVADKVITESRRVRIADILAEISEGSLVDAVSVHDIDLAREVIAASHGSVTWSTAGKSWARLCKATPGVVYPPL